MPSIPPSVKRREKRLQVAVPIVIEWRAGSAIRRARGVTRDVSREGVYCFLEEPVPAGQAVEFDLVFPGELTAAEPLALHCRGTAVRSEVQNRRFALAASIESHEPLRSAELGIESERRVQPRVKPKAAMVVEYPGLRALIRDLSPTGAFIEDERPLPVGRTIELRLCGDAIEPAIQVRAIVRRVEPQVGMGVEFITLSEEARSRLRAMLT